MENSRFAGGCAVLAILACAAIASTSEAIAQNTGSAELILAAPFPGSTAPGGSGSLRAREIAVLTRKGLSPARASQAIYAQEKIAQTRIMRRLLAAAGRGFGGVWFDPTTAQLHIGVLSQAGRRAAEGLIAREGLTSEATTTYVRSTWAQLLRTQRRWNRRLAQLFERNEAETALQAQHNAVAVTLGSSVARRERSSIEREAARSAVAVLVRVARHPHLLAARDAETKCNLFAPNKARCDKPITAGVSIESRNNRALCTAGPLTIPTNDRQRTYLLTAGHCIEKGRGNAKWFAWNTTEAARKEIGQAARQFVNGRTGDVGAINVNNMGPWVEPGATPVFAVTAEWKKAEEKSFAVQAERAPAVGNDNCMEGQTSGGTCGAIAATGVIFDGAEGLVEEEGEATSAGGDSGGPAIATTKGGYLMEGTDVGHTEEDNAVWEPIGTAFTVLNTLKLELLTTSNETRGKESAKEKEEDEKTKKEEKEGNEEYEKQEKEEKEKEEKEGNPTVEPIPTVEAPLEFSATSTKVVLESAKRKIECKEATVSGQLVEVRSGTFSASLAGCKSLGAACHSLGEKGETVVLHGSAELVDLEKGKLVLGLELALNESYAQCAKLALVTLRGSLVGETSGVESGKKTKEATVLFKQEKGKQAIKECHLTKAFCEGKKFMLEEKLKGAAAEEAGLGAEFKMNLGKEAAFSF